MRRKVTLDTLAVGRCFTLALEPGGSTEERSDDARRSDPILSPEDAWKVTGEHGDELQAQNAKGEARSFASSTEVVEIPRQGFDRLAARA